MADLINFTLPSINENMDAKTMKQIKNYLFQLTEQMKFYLNNIDTDNFTDAYNQHLSKMATSQTTNANQMSVTQQQLKAFENNYNYSIKQAVDKISGNNGGYIVTLDTNGDGMPDDLRILADTSNYVTSKKYWQFNRAGLAYIERTNGILTSSLALSADGYIIADRVKGNLGEFVTLNACTLNACTGSFSGKITAQSGIIGDFIIDADATEGLYADYIDDIRSYRTFIQPAYVDKQQTNPGDTWVFSAQYADVTNGNVGQYKSRWYVTANGDTYQYGNAQHKGDVAVGGQLGVGGQGYFGEELTLGSNLYINTHIFDKYGHGIVNISNSDFALGVDKYNHGLNTYLEGGTVFLRHNGGGIEIQEQLTSRIKIDYRGWTFSGVDSTSARRDTIETKGGFVLSANGGNNAMYLVASNIYIRGDLHINWIADSGLAPLYVNSKGVVVCSTSSKRYKENITDDLEDWLNPDKLYDLPVVQYNYKNEFKDNELVAGTQIGITAEDIEKYYPNALIRNAKGQAESWQDRIMIPAMLKLIQKQKIEIEELKAEMMK